VYIVILLWPQKLSAPKLLLDFILQEVFNAWLVSGTMVKKKFLYTYTRYEWFCITVILAMSSKEYGWSTRLNDMVRSEQETKVMANGNASGWWVALLSPTVADYASEVAKESRQEGFPTFHCIPNFQVELSFVRERVPRNAASTL